MYKHLAMNARARKDDFSIRCFSSVLKLFTIYNIKVVTAIHIVKTARGNLRHSTTYPAALLYEFGLYFSCKYLRAQDLNVTDAHRFMAYLLNVIIVFERYTFLLKIFDRTTWLFKEGIIVRQCL